MVGDRSGIYLAQQMSVSRTYDEETKEIWNIQADYALCQL